LFVAEYHFSGAVCSKQELTPYGEDLRTEPQEYPKYGKALNDSFLTAEAVKAATKMTCNIASKTFFRESHRHHRHHIVTHIVT
jgi:hypothetical protein